jgi:hypothetical protein
MTQIKNGIHPSYLGWQVDWPLFVKIPFTGGGRDWMKGQEYKWLELGVNQDKVAKLYSIDYVHHNPDLEKQNKVGDRLQELNRTKLNSLVKLLNAELKSRTVSTKAYDEHRCRQSALDDKQRALIRRFLYSNKWCEEVYYKILEGLIASE